MPTDGLRIEIMDSDFERFDLDDNDEIELEGLLTG